MISLGAGALFVFCYLDVVFVLSTLGAVGSVWPVVLYGSLAAFCVGIFAPTVHSAVLRRREQ